MLFSQEHQFRNLYALSEFDITPLNKVAPQQPSAFVIKPFVYWQFFLHLNYKLRQCCVSAGERSGCTNSHFGIGEKQQSGLFVFI